MGLEIKVSFIQGGKYELEYKRATWSKQKLEINFCLYRCDWIDFHIRKLWDSVFYGYCGSGTFLAFALMTIAILPVALVYSELASLFHTGGGELVYNTVGINKHVGFLASWLIMAAWISVPPAVVMAIMTWVNKTFALNLSTMVMVGCAAVLLVLYFLMSIQNVQFLVKAQAVMLFCNIAVTILTGFILLFSGHWSFANFGNLFETTLQPIAGVPGWIIGMALLITPYFGFETVP